MRRSALARIRPFQPVFKGDAIMLPSSPSKDRSERFQNICSQIACTRRGLTATMAGDVPEYGPNCSVARAGSRCGALSLRFGKAWLGSARPGGQGALLRGPGEVDPHRMDESRLGSCDRWASGC